MVGNDDSIAGGSVLVVDPLGGVRGCRLFQPLPHLLRLDVWPFVILYATLFTLAATTTTAATAAATNAARLSVGIQMSVAILPCVLIAHVLVFLSAQWSVRVRVRIGYSVAGGVGGPSRPVFAWVIPSPNCGAEALVPMQYRPHRKPTNKPTERCGGAPFSTGCSSAWFTFQNVPFFHARDRENAVGLGRFERLSYPCSEALFDYRTCRGYSSARGLSLAREKWGANAFNLPQPAFSALLAGQMLAPFFVFQVFCVMLWCLDEYWYYSIFTLVMLIVFEATVCKQRQRNAEVLRGMQKEPYPLLVFRLGAWVPLLSSELLPGDVCSLSAARRGFNDEEEQPRSIPCDMVIVRGAAVVNEAMLTGESVPQQKESVAACAEPDSAPLRCDSAAHKKHVLFGGTTILQHRASTDAEGTALNNVHGASSAAAGGGVVRGIVGVVGHSTVGAPRPPDHGCVAVVLRSGFGTSQGELMRTILFATEQVTANNRDTFLFILCLLVFAVAASAYVLAEGLKDETRNRFNLFLHCVMIVTSVVPPELPMELSLAVNNSLIALSRLRIWCTEPHRIPFAGKVGACCFDKTGTLTSDDLVLHGVVLEAEDEASAAAAVVVPPESLPDSVALVLAACHALASFDGKYIGDPMEIAAFEGIGWSLGRDDFVTPPPSSSSSFREEKCRIVHRFGFSRELRRMSSVVEAAGGMRLLVKGAPEAMRPLFEAVPANYERVSRSLMARGKRVVALGWRAISRDVYSSVSAVRLAGRDVLESGLTFCGFMVLDCPLKRDSKKIITSLTNATHRVQMITGDNPLTACDVGRDVGMLTREVESTLILSPSEEEDDGSRFGVSWQVSYSADAQRQRQRRPFRPEQTAELAREFDLCVTGAAIQSILHACRPEDDGPAVSSKIEETAAARAVLKMVCPDVKVFARVAPDQKELVINALNASGAVTLMCGDGTNDMGALKQAHVGVSILNCPELEKRMVRMKQKKKRGKADAAAEVPADRDGNLRRRKKNGSKRRSDRELARQLLDEDPVDPSLVRLGDASIASPFTARTPSIGCVVNIVRQGRCTLVTTLQMFKILALNCLISAYMLSSLYLHGIKQGDQQMTVVGLLIAALFFFMSLSKPLKKLSAERPPPTIFVPSVVLSVLGQFIAHFASLLHAIRMCKPFVDENDPALQPDGDFRANVINTTVFLVSITMQANTFAINYHGHPFMQSLSENKLLFRGVQFLYAVIVIAAWEVFTPLNDFLQMVPMPSSDFRNELFMLLVANTICVFLIEAGCRRVFKYRP